MSRRTIALLIGLYLLAALACSIFRVVSSPFFSTLNAAAVVHVIDGALLLMIGAGLPALLLWAFYRFRPRNATLPMLCWVFIGIAFAFFTEMGVRLERDVQVSILAKNLTLSDAKLSCLDGQHANKFRSEVGITDREISAYCNCVSEATASSITPDDVTFIATNGKAPPPLQERAVQLGRPCNRLPVGK
jgi:hypothetical protein